MKASTTPFVPQAHRGVKIAGLGRYLPERVVENAELEAFFGIETGWIAQKTGVLERRRADWENGETNVVMAERACREALDDAGIAPAELDLIINASGTPEQAIPDGGALLQARLGLGMSGIMAMSVHTTCLSFIAALDVAATFIAAGRATNVLISSSEVGSIGVYGEDPKSESLWGDAAAAAVLTATPAGETSSLEHLVFQTFGDGADLTACHGAGVKRHPKLPGTTANDCRFVMQGPEVLKMALRQAPGFFSAFAPAALQGNWSDVDVVVPHQPSKAGLRGLFRVGFPEDKTVQTLDKLGNCVAASIPATLYEAKTTGRLKRGDRVVLFGTGAGLSIAGARLTY